MSWGTRVTAEIFAPHVSKSEIDLVIRKNEESIDSTLITLSMLAIATPRDIMTADIDPVMETQNRVAELLDSYRMCVEENKILYIIRENIDSAKDSSED